MATLAKLAVTGCWLIFFALPAAALEVDAQSSTAAGLGTPRETVQTFLAAMAALKQGEPKAIDKALSTLDLSRVSSLVRLEKGRDYAGLLLAVLERTEGFDPKRISVRPKGDRLVLHRYAEGPLQLVRQDQRWLFGAASLQRLEPILDGLEPVAAAAGQVSGQLPWYMRFRAGLSDSLKVRWFLLEQWQWLGLLLFIAGGIVVDRLVSLLLCLCSRVWRRHGWHLAELQDDWLRPVGLLVLAAVWWIGLNLLGLPTLALVILLVAVKVLAGFSGIWAGYRVTDGLCAYLRHYAGKTENKLDDVLVPLVRKSIKVFVTVVGVLFVASNLNLDISSLVAGLGLGGLAFALAAKDLVQNLFGSITVLLDQSFHVGDWVVIGEIEGTVEEVGLRSTRIRTFYNSEVILPNSRLITASVDNMGKRRFRRLSCKIALTYDTPPARIEAFCEALRELVRLHPYMRKDYYQVYLNELGSASLNVLVYVFWETPDWSTELRERHRFLLDVLRVGERLGVEFAFPTQTIHWKAGSEQSEMAVNDRNDGQLSEDARILAREIVDRHTGLSARPVPVSFRPAGGSGSAGS